MPDDIIMPETIILVDKSGDKIFEISDSLISVFKDDEDIYLKISNDIAHNGVNIMEPGDNKDGIESTVSRLVKLGEKDSRISIATYLAENFDLNMKT